MRSFSARDDPDLISDVAETIFEHSVLLSQSFWASRNSGHGCRHCILTFHKQLMWRKNRFGGLKQALFDVILSLCSSWYRHWLLKSGSFIPLGHLFSFLAWFESSCQFRRKHQCKSIQSYLDRSPLSFDEVLLSRWELPLPRWLRPKHRAGRLTDWFVPWFYIYSNFYIIFLNRGIIPNKPQNKLNNCLLWLLANVRIIYRAPGL